MPAKFALIGYDASGKPSLLRGPDSNYKEQAEQWQAIRSGSLRPDGAVKVEAWSSQQGVAALADLEQIARNNAPAKLETTETPKRSRKTPP